METTKAGYIKAIKTYYRVDYQTAKQLYYSLRAEGKLDSIIDAVAKGEYATTDVICPKCGSNMLIKQGKFGDFWSCVHYPECNGSRSIIDDRKPSDEEIEIAKRKLEIAFKYIKDMGTIDEAKNWLGLAIRTLGNMPNDTKQS